MWAGLAAFNFFNNYYLNHWDKSWYSLFLIFFLNYFSSNLIPKLDKQKKCMYVQTMYFL